MENEIVKNHDLSSESRNEFDVKYKDFNKLETLKEILYTQKEILKQTKANRSNTSKLVWWLVFIPILLSVIFFLMRAYR